VEDEMDETISGNGDQVVALQVHVTAETARDLQRLIAEKGWELEEGLRIILGTGMGYLRGERVLQAVAIGDKTEEEMRQLMTRLIGTESRLASALFRMQDLEQSNQNWDLSSGAIQTENVALKGVVDRQKKEIRELTAKIEELEQEIQQLRSHLGAGQEEAVETVPEKKRSIFKLWK